MVTTCNLNVTTNLLGGLCVIVDVAYIEVAFRVIVVKFVNFSGDLFTTKIDSSTSA